MVNGGGVQAKGVVVTPAVAGTAAANCGAVTPGATNIAANGWQIFSFTCMPTSAGALTLSGTAAGTDANSGPR